MGPPLIPLVRSNDQSQTSIEGVALEELAVPFVPGAGSDVGPQPIEALSEPGGVAERESRCGLLHCGVEIRLRPSPEGHEEAVGAVRGDGHRDNVRRLEGVDNFGESETSSSVELGDLGNVLLDEPQLCVDIGVVGEDDRSISDAPKFPVAGGTVLPVVDCEERGRDVEGAVFGR